MKNLLAKFKFGEANASHLSGLKKTKQKKTFPFFTHADFIVLSIREYSVFEMYFLKLKTLKTVCLLLNCFQGFNNS